MANLSSATGSMVLVGDWDQNIIISLNSISENIWATWWYGIYLDKFETEEGLGYYSSGFNAFGRWTFSLSLSSIGRATLASLEDDSRYKDIFLSLIKEMYEKNLYIEVDFSDNESGNGVLYQEEGRLYSNGETFQYEVMSSVDYEYNWENFLNIVEDTGDFDSLVDSACKTFNIERTEEIERWFKTKTLPSYRSFQDLETSLKEEFCLLFTDKG